MRSFHPYLCPPAIFLRIHMSDSSSTGKRPAVYSKMVPKRVPFGDLRGPKTRERKKHSVPGVPSGRVAGQINQKTGQIRQKSSRNLAEPLFYGKFLFLLIFWKSIWIAISMGAILKSNLWNPMNWFIEFRWECKSGYLAIAPIPLRI